MKFAKFFSWERYQQYLKITAALVLVVVLSISLFGGSAFAANRKSQLAQGNAITDAQSLLRYALPIENEQIRKLQASLEDISYHIRTKRWGKVKKDAKEAGFVAKYRQSKILASVPEERQAQAQEILEQMLPEISQLQDAAAKRNEELISQNRSELLAKVTQIEELMVVGFPFEVPEKYDYLPQLKGRATVEMATEKGNLIIVADGYSAPVNAGNFVDLVQRGFYDGLKFGRGEDSYFLQTGDPPGAAVGFNDPNTGEYRSIPLEVLVKGEDEPVYEVTLEEYGIYLPDLALPFSAYGTLALARPSGDANGGSSQIFFFLLQNDLTPPGFNLLDGRYSVFGYVVEGKEVLKSLKAGDKIISAQVIAGAENFLAPVTQ